MRLWLAYEAGCMQKGSAEQEESWIRSIYLRCRGLSLYLKTEFGFVFLACMSWENLLPSYVSISVFYNYGTGLVKSV